MSEWTLAIDYGTTYTAAAIARSTGIELLYFNGVPRIPSLVLRNEQGEILVGTTAENETLITPDRVLRAPKRRLGDRMVLLGDAPLAVVDAVAAVLAAVLDEAKRQHGGTDPTRVVMTHPARWGKERLVALADAAGRAGLPAPEFIPEPVAAALHYMATGDDPISNGDRVAVYDLGGGTFDTAVLERASDKGFEIVATGGSEYQGGEDFDEIVYRHFGMLLAEDSAPAWEQLRHSEDRPWKNANAEFRRDVRLLKEDLSTSNARSVYIRYPVDRELQLTRSELEALLRPELDRTLDELAATIQRSGSKAEELAALYLVGGSSRLRLLPQLVRDRFGRADTRDDPKAVVALGAARAEALWTDETAVRASGEVASATRPADTEGATAREPEPVPSPPTRPQAPGIRTAAPADAAEQLPDDGPVIVDTEPTVQSPREPLVRRLRQPPIIAAALATIGVLAIIVLASANLGAGSDPSPLPSAGLTWATDLEVGDCFIPAESGAAEVAFEQVEIVPCEDPHRYEVHHSFEYRGALDSYPSERSFQNQAATCIAYGENLVGAPLEDVNLEAFMLVPLEEQWRDGDRTITCTLRRPGGNASMTGSQADSGDDN